MDSARRKVLYNDCHPEQELKPDNPLNVDLDTAGPGGKSVRGKNWVLSLSDDIELSDVPQCLFFTGLSGSGKTTEFLRLAKRLRELEYLPVYINSEDLLDLSTPIDLPDILITIFHKVEQAILELPGLPEESEASRGLFGDFWQWLESTDVQLTKMEFGVQGAKAEFQLRDKPQLREWIRRRMESNVTEFVRQCHVAIQRFDEWARVYGKGLVIIYDSLEKLQGMVSNYQDVLASAEMVFVQMRNHLAVPAHVIYTVPQALLARTTMPVEFFPMIKVKTREGLPDKPGMDAARELVRRRVPDADLREMLGAECETRIDTVILRSGGYPRDIVRMLRQIIRQGEFPISGHEFERVLNEAAERYQKLVTLDACSWLARVALDKVLLYDSEEQRKVGAHMLANNLVLRYLNTGEWYDLHPAVAVMPGVAKAVQQLADGQKASC